MNEQLRPVSVNDDQPISPAVSPPFQVPATSLPMVSALAVVLLVIGLMALRARRRGQGALG